MCVNMRVHSCIYINTPQGLDVEKERYTDPTAENEALEKFAWGSNTHGQVINTYIHTRTCMHEVTAISHEHKNNMYVYSICMYEYGTYIYTDVWSDTKPVRNPVRKLHVRISARILVCANIIIICTHKHTYYT